MTIGDVLAVVASILGIWLSTWSLLMVLAVIFSERTKRTRDKLESQPWKAFWFGTGIAIPAGLLGLILVSQPNGLFKLFGWVLLLGLLGICALGGGGLALLVGDRLQTLDARLSGLGALGRGAAFIIIAGLVPVLGWFLFVPLAAIMALGAGCQVLADGKRERVSEAALPVSPSEVI